MQSRFGKDLHLVTVQELVDQDMIFVEDGNHGEYRPLQHEFTREGVPFIRPPDLKNGKIDFDSCDHINEVAFKRVRKGIGHGGDIVLTHRATVGRLAITSIEDPLFVTNPGTTIWRSLNDKVLDQKYLYYFMCSPAFMEQLTSEVGNNCTFDYVSLTQQRGLLVALIPIAKQHAIANMLRSLDDKIELNRRMNETLEAMARAIFKSWFVDFDPVRAKADGREPAGMDAETAALFPDSFEETELGMIPNGWKIKSLDEIADFLNGMVMQKFPPEGEDFLPVIKIAELHRGNTIGSDRASSNIDPRYIIEDGDILFSWSGSLEVCIWCGGKGALNQHLFKVTSADYPKWFYYFWLKEHLPQFQMIAAGKATTMGHIQRYHLREAEVVIPITPLLERVNIIIQSLIQRIIKNNLESRSLSSIRDALLPKLLSGDVKVEAARMNLGTKL